MLAMLFRDAGWRAVPWDKFQNPALSQPSQAGLLSEMMGCPFSSHLPEEPMDVQGPSHIAIKAEW